MPPQEPPTIPTPDPGIEPSPAKPKSPMKMIVTVVLGVAVVVLLILVIVFASQASSTQRKLDSSYKSGYDEGAKKQRESDLKEFEDEKSKDFRIYKGSEEFGGFEISLPKSWSWTITPNSNDGTFTGIADPNFVDTKLESHALKLEITKADFDKVKKDLDSQASKSKGAIKASELKVSGITSYKYVGIFDAKKKLKEEIVIVPVREKTVTFSTGDSDRYSETFNNILNNTKLNP